MVQDYNSPIRRLNYYNGQLLKKEHFKTEQEYHIKMRQKLNRAFISPGIVDGLEVKILDDQKKVKISPGMAIDKNGREIFLYEAKEEPYQASKKYLVIEISESDKELERDGSDYFIDGSQFRWTEKESEIGEGIILAEVIGEGLVLKEIIKHGEMASPKMPKASGANGMASLSLADLYKELKAGINKNILFKGSVRSTDFSEAVSAEKKKDGYKVVRRKGDNNKNVNSEYDIILDNDFPFSTILVNQIVIERDGQDFTIPNNPFSVFMEQKERKITIKFYHCMIEGKRVSTQAQTLNFDFVVL